MAAQEQLELDVNRCFMESTWVQTQAGFPNCGVRIPLYMGDVTSITSITYEDADGALQTIDSADYVLDSGRNAVTCLLDEWPQTLEPQSGRDVVTITFQAGGTDATCVPRLAKQAILLEVGRAYFDPAQENGVNTNDGRSYERIVHKLLSTYYA